MEKINMDLEMEVVPHIIYEVVSGSHSYGLNGPDSDEDIRAAFIPHPRRTFGLSQCNQQSGEGDDEVLVPLHDLVRHFYTGSTTWVEILFLEPRFIRKESHFWSPFREHRKLFLSKNLARKTCGMVGGLARRAEKHFHTTASEDVSLVRKQLMHSVRAGRMVLETLSEFHLRVHRAEDREHLLAIRNGSISLEAAHAECQDLLIRLDEAMVTSPLQDKPDMRAIDDLLVHVMTSYWAYQMWI